jgi:hypothetical protein
VQQITVDVQDSVYDGLEQFARDRGLDVVEGVKWLLGDFIHNNVFRRYAPGQMQVVPATPSAGLDPLLKFVIAETLKAAGMKCPHCQAVLTVKDIEVNGCGSCNKKLF